MSNGSEHLAERVYTPSTERVRDLYSWAFAWRTEDDIEGGETDLSQVRATQRAEFDRWLAGHDAEQVSRIAALEAVIARVRSQLAVEGLRDMDGEAWVLHEPLYAMVSAAPSTVLDQMIREAKAEAVEAFGRELLERYPADVFRSLSDADHKSVNDALASRAERTHVTRDAISADMMRRAAAQARDYAAEIRNGDA